jgi:hypothetical protein
MDGGEQTQQMHPVELSSAVLSMSPARVTGRPTLIDEVVGNQRSQQFEQFGRAGRRKIGVHGASAYVWKSNSSATMAQCAIFGLFRWL